jgi:hypothetical protein
MITCDVTDDASVSNAVEKVLDTTPLSVETPPMLRRSIAKSLIAFSAPLLFHVTPS